MLEPVTPPPRVVPWVIAIALAGAALVWRATSQGAGLSPDSVHYVAAARWLLAGEGLRSLDGSPLAHFPPLYPIVLAGAAWVSGSDPLDAARWLNAGLFGVLLALAGLLAARVGRRTWAAVAAALVLLVSRDIVLLHAMAWSEPLALVFGTAGLALVARHLETGRLPPLAFAAVGLGLAALARYASIAHTLAATVGLLWLDRATPPPRRAVKALALASVAAAPLAISWLLAGAGRGLGGRTVDFHPLSRWDVRKATAAVLGWVAPPEAPLWVKGVLLTLLTVGIGAAVFRRRAAQQSASSPLAAILLLGAGVYLAFILGCRMTVDAAILFDARILAPAQVLLVIATMGLVALRVTAPVPTRALALGGAVLVLLSAHAVSTGRWARSVSSDGLFYTRRGLRQSALLDRVRALPPTALVWSNAPDAVYILTGRCVRLLPRRTRPESGRLEPGFASDWQALLGQPEAYVAWFKAFAWRSYLPTESELVASAGVAPLAPLRDGTLYRIAVSGEGSVPTAAHPGCAPARGARGARAYSYGAPVEWLSYGGDPANTRYSPLSDIDRSNVAQLQRAWSWRNAERRGRAPDGSQLPLGKFETTPIMVGDTLFLTTPNHRVVALDAESGAELWSFDPREHEEGAVRSGHRYVHRGLAIWSGNGAAGRRLFHASRGRMFAIDAATGKPAAEFGAGGLVDLLSVMGWSGDPNHVDNTSPPAVYDDLVIVGSSVSDDVTHPGDPPGAVVALDARSGRTRWVFRTIPQTREPGYASWSAGTTGAGHANVWAPMTVDTARGLLYVPVAAASNDYYGGRRPGANLFSESLVCLDVRTGKRKWHFQTVHHGLWDYDLPGPPVLATVRQGDRAQDVVAVAGKTGFVYVFDRVTGAPVWPIEERAVPASDVPGEVAAATQPFPTRPAPFAHQGFSEADLIDFTPQLRDSVRAMLGGARFGPLFSPPSIAGTVVMPGRIGGAPWGGAAYDPERQLLFVKANNQPTLVKLASPGPPNSAVDAPYIGLLQRGWRWLAVASSQQELPINKPPYGTLTAIDLASGEHRWQATVGNWPELSNHPALRGLDLPPLGSVGTSGATVTRAGLVFISGGSTSLHVLDAVTGRQVWEAPFRGRGHANPMTYRTRSGRQFVVIAVSRAQGGELLAFALPRR